MAFYTPSWIRKVVKEDAEYIVKSIVDDKKDFRDYVDSRLPFVLWLEIGEIYNKVLKPNMPLLQTVVEKAFPSNQVAWALETLESVLLDAYKKVINKYINNLRYTVLTSDQLEELLKPLNTLEQGQLRPYINKTFTRTYRVGGSLSKKDKCVMLIAPSFNAIKFGTEFRAAIDLNPFKKVTIDTVSGKVSAYDKIIAILSDTSGNITGRKQDFYTQLQNVGHIEVDVISEEDRKVKRGQVSPRFIQALVSVPNQPNVISKLQVDFSKQTLQHTTRIIVRKKFQKSKLVFEMLIDYGLPVGIPESQITNLRKGTRERAFGPGSGLTSKIKNNPEILFELETSKSAKKYLEENLKSMLQSGKGLPNYVSTFSTTQKVSKTVSSVKLKKIRNTSTGVSTNRIKSAPQELLETNLTSLLNSLNQRITQQVRQNMGTGYSKDVLNYRTGRFAQSVKVERLSESRAGMITAFYSYMKNPYATFSAGGRQELPRSRDPKTLISKSIREIAATLVTNRLRAVST